MHVMLVVPSSGPYVAIVRVTRAETVGGAVSAYGAVNIRPHVVIERGHADDSKPDAVPIGTNPRSVRKGTGGGVEGLAGDGGSPSLVIHGYILPYGARHVKPCAANTDGSPGGGLLPHSTRVSCTPDAAGGTSGERVRSAWRGTGASYFRTRIRLGLPNRSTGNAGHGSNVCSERMY